MPLNHLACQSHRLHNFDSKRYIQPTELLIFFGMRHRQRISCTPLESTNIWLVLQCQGCPVQGKPVLASHPRAVKSTCPRLAVSSSMQVSLLGEPRRFTTAFLALGDVGRKHAGVFSLRTNQFTLCFALYTWKTPGLLYRTIEGQCRSSSALPTSGDEAIKGSEAHLGVHDSHDIRSKQNEAKYVLMMPIPDPPRTAARIVTPRGHNRRRWVLLGLGREADRRKDLSHK